MRSADNQLGSSILALKSVLGSNVGVVRVLKICGWFLKCDLEKTMAANVEFSKSCRSVLEFVKRVDEMGIDRKSRAFLHGVRTMSSMTVENWELKLELFRRFGFSEEGIVLAFKKSPQAFASQRGKLRRSHRFSLSLQRRAMESNGAEASQIRREIDSLKLSKIEIERRISALESQLRDIEGDGWS
ncbi:hypothetical protein RHSIM_Rhsim06G0083700 [Rhododendron simsii]|uniref:Uncharacterized protein n=1 Tax=Rhododendron simsii TaxID=118357 RepID=A0A834GRP3_RHOSS|nr:hypothetical protein RHSIM_Rhsim06G0083700 [Rhododendron simsii]